MRTLLNTFKDEGFSEIPTPAHMQLSVVLNENRLKHLNHSTSLGRVVKIESKLQRLVDGILGTGLLNDLTAADIISKYTIDLYSQLTGLGIHNPFNMGVDDSFNLLGHEATDIVIAYVDLSVEDSDVPIKFLKHDYKVIQPVDLDLLDGMDGAPTVSILNFSSLLVHLENWLRKEKARAKADINYVMESSRQFVRKVMDLSISSFVDVGIINCINHYLKYDECVFQSTKLDIHLKNPNNHMERWLGEWKSGILRNKMELAEIAHNISLTTNTALEFMSLKGIPQTRNINWLLNYARADYFHLLLNVAELQGSNKNKEEIWSIKRELNVLRLDSSINVVATREDYRHISGTFKEKIVPFLNG